MKTFLKFLRSTLIGGILFLVPVLLVIVVIGKAIELAAKVIDPLARDLPIHSIIGLPLPVFLAASLILLFCLVSGIFARTRAAGRIVTRLEGGVLTGVPGYEFFKDVGQNLVGVTPQHVQQAILVRLDDSWQFAFLMERLSDGLVTVFVPDAPSPWSGSVRVIMEDQIMKISITPAAALKCLRRLGCGSEVILHEFAKSRDTSASAAAETKTP